MSISTSPAPGLDPPRRAFGSFSKQAQNNTQTLHQPIARPPSSASTSSLTPTPSNAPSPSPYLAAPEPQRTRSSSSASTEAFETAATKAQAWLQTWAPYKGEGRGREFLSNTLNGVAGVASTVTHGINGAVIKGVQLNEQRRSMSRPASYSGPPMAVDPGFGNVPPPLNGSALATSPPAPTHTVSTTAIPTGRKIPQPANFARLGNTSSPPPESTLRPPNPHAATTPAVPHSHRRTSSSSPLASGTIPAPHGPSHLNPHHVRTGSTSHVRTSSFGGATSQALSRSSSNATGGRSLTGKSHGMPYKIGFQPAGVRNDRSEEFQDARKAAGEERDKEEGRLGRRWAKLVDLHFNPTTPNPASPIPTLSRSSSSSFSSSNADKRRSILSIDGAFDALKGSREVWKGVKTNLDPRAGPAAEEARRRAAEQAIVKWEDDGEARKCRICQAAFGLSNRKHHCRLCGRLVCSLPPTPSALLAVQAQLFSPSDGTSSPLPPGTRKEKCSLLLVADWKTGRGEEVDEGFVGWMKLQDGDESVQINGRRERKKGRSSVSSTATSATDANGGMEKRDVPLPQQPKEVQVKGVRSCRECWAVVSRKQKIADRQRVNGFARLYSALRSLQADIEDIMPDFEEQMDNLTSSFEPEEPNKEILDLHKQLLTLFAQYEHLSKRISSLSVEEGSSQASVQSAVARTAAMFLAKEMIKIQALPKLQKKIANVKRKNLGAAVVETTLADQLKLEGIDEGQAVDVAVTLQPLLEQEDQLETMIADANAQRKYEDSKALSIALEEIRLEIGRVTSEAMA